MFRAGTLPTILYASTVADIFHCCDRQDELSCRPVLEGTMKLSFLVITLTLAALLAGQPSQAQNAFTPDEVKYGPAPPFLPVGAQLAVLEGDPMASSGDFTIRLKMPDGYKVAPHTHPSRENVTVLSGTLKVGMGDQFDASKMMSFGSGSFAYLDPSMHHYAMSSGATVIQIHGTSPVKFNYINPADDPSMKK
jgi:mannose-6-phosphate isomerase-like protein (cupin superfamily)